MLVLQDVTGERELERTRSEFVATASHELRTPLSAVYGAVRTLRRPDLQPDPELEAQLLGIIESESDQLKDIVERILMSAEIDRGALTLRQGPCDVRELAASALEAARLHAPDDIDLRLDAHDDVTITCDAGKLRQVVVNLDRQRNQVLARRGHGDRRGRRGRPEGGHDRGRRRGTRYPRGCP